MIVIVAGMPRAGSTWTYNVVRAMLEAKGIKVLPELIPVDEIDLIRNALMSEETENEVYCIKTHLALKIGSLTRQEVKIICNIRDVRDACLSIMRFTRADFETGIHSMHHMMNISDYYLGNFRENLLDVRFEYMTRTPRVVLDSISDFLRIDLPEGKKLEILERFDKASIQEKLRMLKDVPADTSSHGTASGQQSRFDTVRNFDGTHRVYDKTSAFHSNHITSSRDGEWRTYFDRDQTGRMTELSREWLLKHGYKV